jgi:hypothetical protein
MRKECWGLVILVCAGLSHVLFADETIRDVGPITRVTGNVLFEKRATVVPMLVCETKICPKSEPYWVLVVADGLMKYEVGQIFEKGSEVQPEAIELAGVVIRPGSRISIDGRVESVCENYAIVNDIQGASLLMDQVSLLKIRTSGALLWNCQSVGNFQERLKVEVWDREQKQRPSDYEIRVLASLPNGLKNVARVRGAELQILNEEFVFRGINENSEVQLSLDQSNNMFADVPAQLHFSKMQPGPTYRVPLEIRDQLLCDRGSIHY